MKPIYTLIFFLFTGVLFGQYDIDIKLKNYDNDTVIIGHYYADKQLVKDTLYALKKGRFEFEGKDTLKQGVYFVLTKPKNDFIQFFINGEDNEFDLEWNVNEATGIKFKGSEDNSIFVDYMRFLQEKRATANQFRGRITVADSLGTVDKDAEEGLDKVDAEVMKYQDKIISSNPTYITTKFLKSSKQLDLPEFEGEDKQFKTYRYYKNHYFDNIELGDPANLRSPYLHNRVQYYLEKLTPQDPDSLINSIDYMLGRMEPSPETYKYYLSYFLNTYAKMKIVGMDKVYVHLVENYYAPGKADWVKEESLKKMKENANNLRSILIGKKFPDITTYKIDLTPVRIWDVESPYTILLFWAHDCGHCTKSMPDIVDFYDEFQDKGVTLISICTKGGKKMKPCQEALPKKNMEKFINTFDEYQRYRKLAYIPSTPKIFILDKDKKIILKDIPANRLKDIMGEIMKMDSLEK